MDALNACDAVSSVLLLKPIHLVPVQLARPPRSQQAPHQLPGWLLGLVLQDCRCEDVKTLRRVFAERFVGKGHPRRGRWLTLQHRQRLRGAAVELARCGHAAVDTDDIAADLAARRSVSE